MNLRKFAETFLAAAIVLTPIEALANEKQFHFQNASAPVPSLICSQDCRNDLAEGLAIIFQKADHKRKGHIPAEKQTKLPTIEEMGIHRAEQTLKASLQEEPYKQPFRIYSL